MKTDRLMDLPAHDVLVRMAREDPEAFEVLRRELVEHCIASAPVLLQPRLRQLQLRIDGIRITSPSPLIASQRLQRLMGESVLQLEEAFHQIIQLAYGKAPMPDRGQARTTWRTSLIPGLHDRPDAGLNDRF